MPESTLYRRNWLKDYKKKKPKEWITKKQKKNIVDTAKEATDFIKKEFPKIGKDY